MALDQTKELFIFIASTVLTGNNLILKRAAKSHVQGIVLEVFWKF